MDDCFTDKISLAIEDIVNPGRWIGIKQWGLWPVNFSLGATEEYSIPNFGWHIDGNWFRHTLDCPKQGLLVIGLFSDIESRWGGTIVAEGSHKLTARVLADHPDGLPHRELFDRVMKSPLGGFRELTGQAGDVVLAHPFLFHTRGYKHMGPPRFISNTEAPLKEPMQLNRNNSDEYSILELSILQALQDAPESYTDEMQCQF